jgi:ferredoxin-NADP reductase
VVGNGEFPTPERLTTLARQLLTARLERKLCLSEPAQCFHLEFTVDELEAFDFIPGQFVSTVADDPKGKQQTRAYSIASAPSANRFDLCVNRVESGFFSNLLCDLEPGQTVGFHGPHGLFTLRQPLTDGIFIATGTGVAPMRGFVQHLFPDNPASDCGSSTATSSHEPREAFARAASTDQREEPREANARAEGPHFWLVYGTRHETDIYYQKYFERVAAQHPNFHYLASLSRPHEGWEGLRGYVQEHVARIVTERAERAGERSAPQQSAAEPQPFDIHAYICGLNDMVSASRDRLVQLGWQRKQVIFERYD